MLKISEEKLHESIHDILKVVGKLKEMFVECKDCDKKNQLSKYEKELLRIRVELLQAIDEE